MLLALLLLLQEHAPGKHTDIFATDAESAKVAAKDADAASERFKEIFGIAPVRLAMVVQKDGQPAPGNTARYVKNGAKSVIYWERRPGYDEMTHELGHVWLLFWVDGPPKEAPKDNRYGSSLPDWLDEAGATLFDLDDMRTRYRTDMRTFLKRDQAMPLSELFACVHPQSLEKGGRQTRQRPLALLLPDPQHPLVHHRAGRQRSRATRRQRREKGQALPRRKKSPQNTRRVREGMEGMGREVTLKSPPPAPV